MILKNHYFVNSHVQIVALNWKLLPRLDKDLWFHFIWKIWTTFLSPVQSYLFFQLPPSILSALIVVCGLRHGILFQLYLPLMTVNFSSRHGRNIKLTELTQSLVGKWYFYLSLFWFHRGIFSPFLSNRLIDPFPIGGRIRLCWSQQLTVDLK